MSLGLTGNARLSAAAKRPQPPDRAGAKPAAKKATHSDRTVDEEQRLDLLIGDRAHRTIARILAGEPLPENRAAFSLRVLDAAREVLEEWPATTERKRALLIGTSTYASAYMRRFAPGAPWLFSGAEVALGSGRADLVFENQQTHQVGVDEIKAGASRRGHTAGREQVLRYLAGGRQKWGASFIGVRLIWLASPFSSQFYGANALRGRPLSDTPYLSLGDPR